MTPTPPVETPQVFRLSNTEVVLKADYDKLETALSEALAEGERVKASNAKWQEIYGKLNDKFILSEEARIAAEQSAERLRKENDELRRLIERGTPVSEYEKRLSVELDAIRSQLSAAEACIRDAVVRDAFHPNYVFIAGDGAVGSLQHEWHKKHAPAIEAATGKE